MEEKKKYVVNGREYDSIEEVPAEYRALLEQAEKSRGVTLSVHKTFSFRVNGKDYGSVKEMPENVRRIFEDRNNNGVPDIAEGVVPAVPVRTPRSGTVLPSVIKEDSSNRLLFLTVALAAVGALIYFFAAR